MPQTRDTPTFNMKAVVRETGLKPDTLRAWERRYNLPQPGRTEGGHRLYSQRDLDTLQWLMAQQAEGLSISRAVKLWYRLESEGHDPLQIIPAPGTIESIATRPFAVGGETIDNFRDEWLLSCQAFDESSAERVLTEALAIFPVEVVCIEVLQKGLAQIGEWWFEGKITVQQEHFASALAARRIEALLAAAAAPVRPGRILVVCAPGEEHTFGLLLLTLLLRRRGWEAIYLGANVPADQLENALKATNPNLVVASAQLLHTAASLLDLAEILSVEGIPLAYGGRIFNMLPELQARIPGHYLGPNLETAVQMVESVLTSTVSLPEVTRRQDKYDVALAHFQERQALVEGAVWQMLQMQGVHFSEVASARGQLSRQILAALKLGDMGFLVAEINWIQGLMSNRGVADDMLHHYLSTYGEAIALNLDERGRPVKDWFSQLLKSESLV